MRRTRLERHTPMPRGKGLRASQPFRPCEDTDPGPTVPQRRRRTAKRRDTGPTRKVRDLVMRRDGYRCARCGLDVRCMERSIQHRRGRGMGGTRRADTNSPAALILLCGSGTTRCHGHVEAHPHEALGYGWRIPQAAVDPADWRVWIDGRGWVLLDHDGGWRPA